MADAVKVIDGAIAAFGAAPVLYAAEETLAYARMGELHLKCLSQPMGDAVIPLYRHAQPVPVVPVEMNSDTAWGGLKISAEDCQAWSEGWNACRAAMLQGTDGKPELTVWYGSMPETNGKTNWTAMLHRKGQHPWEGITIDRSEYPDRVRYEADRMRHLIGELPDEPDILSYDADAHSGYVNPGNSPVTPDGSEDTKRLDWLDAQNKRLNEYYGTSYGWKFDANFQRNAMMLNDINYPVMTVRQAIDEAIAEAPKLENI